MEDYIIDIIEDMAKEYFQNNNNNYNITKAVLSTKLEIGSTKTEAVCKELEIEYPFIKNGRGFIIIDKKVFSEWEILRKEQSKHITSFVELTTKYPQLAKSIDYYKGEIERKGKLVSERERENQGLEDQAKELEQKANDFEANIKEKQSKIENLKAEYDRLKEESEAKDREYNEKMGAEIQRLDKEFKAKKEEADAKLKKAKEDSKKSIEEHNRKVREEEDYIKEQREEAERREEGRNWFDRHRVIDYQYEKSPFDKFLGEAIRFFIYGIAFSLLIAIL